MPRFAGGQLTGRFAWPSELIEAARKYTREKTEPNLKALREARVAAAREIIALQEGAGFGFITDGGTGVLDIFTPYSSGAGGGGSGGNIDKYPGTRNSYYHTPVVKSKLKAESVIADYLHTEEIKRGRKKAILPSPASLALAAENSHYRSLGELVLAYAEVLREDVRELGSLGYDLVQLNECFLTADRFSKRVPKGFAEAFAKSVDSVFRGFRGRSCVYFHSGDASRYIPLVLGTGVTDVGFDFNTPADGIRKLRFAKNVTLGLQNATRKLPDEWLEKEPGVLVGRTREYLKEMKIGADREVFLSPSQDYDGLQTFPQARRRLGNLAKAAEALREDPA